MGLIALNLIGDPLPPLGALPLSPITNTAPALAATAASLGGLSLGAGAPVALAAPAQPLAPAAGAAGWPPVAVPAGSVPGLAPGPQLAKSSSALDGGSSGAAGLAAELSVDLVTAQKILELQEQKKQARGAGRRAGSCL